jgi:hypothetical protein
MATDSLEIAENIVTSIHEMMLLASRNGLIDLLEMENDRMRDARWYRDHVRQLVSQASGGNDAEVS